MKKREKIEDAYKWDLTSLCESDDVFYRELEKIKEYIVKVQKFKGKLKNEKILFSYFKFCNEFSLKFGKLSVYAACKHDQDQGNSVYVEMNEKIQQLSTQFSVANSFGAVEICGLSDKKLNKLYENKKFEEFSEIIRSYIKNKKHMLTLEQEEVIAGMGDFIDDQYSVFSKFSNVDIKFESIYDSKGKKHKVDNANASKYILSNDRELRKNVNISIANAFKNVANTLASNYASYIKQKVYFAKLRKYKSCLHSSLFDEDIDKSVYDRLIKKVNENLDVHYKMLDLVRQALNLDKMASYDVYAPFTKNQNKKINIEDAFKCAREIISPLGDEYVQLFDKSIKDKWYDIFPNHGKRIGAYSSGAYGSNPVILLNFDDTDSYIDTIVHEFGHSAHTYYSNKTQPYSKSSYGIFAAEIASTVNENLHYFYKKAKAKTKSEKLKVYHSFWQNLHAVVFNQTMFSECEQQLYETVEKGGVLTTDTILNIYDKQTKKYFGKNVEILKDQKYKWADIPHFFYEFYVYMYVTGYIASFVIAKRIINGDEETKRKYLNFLKQGCSKPVIELLKEVGVDFTKDEIYDEVFENIKEEVQSFEKLIKKK